jgi:hypothetical protein
LLPIDIDEQLTIEAAKERFKEYEYVAYTTFNHSPTTHKFRLFILLKDPVTAQEFTARKDALREFIGVADIASISQAQGFYLPSCHEGNRDIAKVWSNEGAPLDLLALPKYKVASPVKVVTPSSFMTISTLPETARSYLYDFFYQHKHLYRSAHHQNLLKLASILKSFDYSASEAIDLLNVFKSPASYDDVTRSFDKADAKYGGMGSLVSLLKRFGAYNDFNLATFNRLSGIYNLNTIKSDLYVNAPKVAENKVLSATSVLVETEITMDGMVETPIYEKLDKLSKILSDADFPVGVTLLKSPTNSGKTHLFVNGLSGKRIIVLPTKALVDQVAKHKGVAKCYDGKLFPLGESVIAMTYNKLELFIKMVDSGAIGRQEYDLFVDEAHNLYTSYNYRDAAMNIVYDTIQLKYCRKVVLMSGTLKNEFLPALKIDKQVNVTREQPTQQQCNVIKTNDPHRFLMGKVEIDGKSLVLLNNKAQAEQLAIELNANGLPAQVFHKDNQQDTENQLMLIDESVKAKVLIFTQIGVEGLNLNNQNIKQVIAFDHHGSVTLEQVNNRARKNNTKLYVLRNDNSKDDGFLSQMDVTAALNDAKKFVDFANSVLGHTDSLEIEATTKQLLTTIKSLPSNLKYSVRYNESAKQFEVSHLGLAAKVYEMDCTNEGYNAELFDEHMAEYHFTVTRKTVLYDKDTVSKAIKEKAKRVTEAQVIEEQTQYLQLMGTIADSLELKDLAQTVASGSHPELGILKDPLTKSAILSNYYRFDDVMELITHHIKDNTTFNRALDYAKQVRDNCLFRKYFEAALDLNKWYTIHALRQIVVNTNNHLSAKHKMNLEKMLKSDNGQTRGFKRLFKVEDARSTKAVIINGKLTRPKIYRFASFNPIGMDILPKINKVPPSVLTFKGQPLSAAAARLSTMP